MVLPPPFFLKQLDYGILVLHFNRRLCPRSGIGAGEMAVDYFVPGTTPPATGLLGGLLPTWPEGVAQHFVETYTHPDAVVLDPFAVSEIPIRETLAAGRRVIATNSNPLVVLLLRQRLSPPAPDALKVALTRLGDSPKRGGPLRDHLSRLYRTHCPTCNHQGVAEYFIWTRAPADPRQKWVDCPACGQAGLAAVDENDLAVLDEVETRGLHYWYLLDRVASSAKSSPSDEARAHAETLLELYTPRALYAIADLLMRIEATFDEETQVDLKTALLSCLDAASNLYPPDTASGETLARPALDKLHPPRRFIERNVWQLFEASVQQMAESAALVAPLPLQPDLHWVTRVPSSPQGLVWVHNLGAGAVGRGLTPESVSLVLTTPPRPDPVFWSLAYLWTGWIFGPGEAARLKSLALQKWPDWAWYVTTMTTALRALRPVVRFDGACVLLFHGSPPQQAFAIVLAALAAGYDIESWQHRATGEHQCSLVPVPLRTPPAEDPEVLRRRVIAEGAKAATKFIRARGEPVQPETLHIAAWHRLMRKGILEVAQASLPTSRVLSWLNAAIGQGLKEVQGSELVSVIGDDDQPVGWWLRKVGRGVNDPLSDRIEEAVLSALRDADAKGDASVEETALVQSIYRRFNGPLTPDAGLVHTCLRAYGEEPLPGHWRLHRRERETMWDEGLSTGVRDLLMLGERLGYRVRQKRRVMDVVWEEEGRPWATFNLIATAKVAHFLPHLDTSLPQQEIRWRNLVIPAARTGLWQHKLETNPWLAQTIKAGGWTFIKLEHLRSLAAKNVLTRHDLKAIVGLVPLIESGEGQLPLF
jgi:hypothetical protein